MFNLFNFFVDTLTSDQSDEETQEMKEYNASMGEPGNFWLDPDVDN